MSTVSVLIEKSETKAAEFRATIGGHHSIGKTRGEALDALMAEWTESTPQLEVKIEPLLSKNEGEEYVEPHLVLKEGLWVIAGGGKMSPEDARRDFVAEMREERIRSFFPDALP